MFMYLFFRVDRLGSNLFAYIAQILLCHKKQYIIKFRDNSKEYYKFHESIYVKILFDYIDKQNELFYKMNIDDTEEYIMDNQYDLPRTTSLAIEAIQTDMITYFMTHIYPHISNHYNELTANYSKLLPFDVNKTILVHLRLGDVIYRNDYDGSICSDYYKNQIANHEYCCNRIEFYGRCNEQAPLSKDKLDKIIHLAKSEYPDHKVLFLTCPYTDISSFEYECVRSNDHDFDLYLLSMCKVTILSRSTYSFSSLFFNADKDKTYIPLWGHFVCCGLDTIYDNVDKSKFTYFY